MESDTFLHEQKDFNELIQIVSSEHGIIPQLVEKDYWIMHCLHGLTMQGFSFKLKGGTSLSKGYGIIDRFSEDIDIQIDPPPEMDVKFGKNHTKDAHIASRRAYFEWLVGKIKIHGLDRIEIDHAYDDPTGKWRNVGIQLKYPSKLDLLKGVKDGVLLEVGFDDVDPNYPMNISSWAYEKAAKERVPFSDNLAYGIKCYRPEYTFVEKLQTVSTKFRQQQESGEFQTNFLRHYYDIYCLLGFPDVQEFLGTGQYVAHKKRRFRTQDEFEITKNKAFLFSEPDVRAQYKLEYEKTEDLYYKGMIPFDTILERVQQNIDKL